MLAVAYSLFCKIRTVQNGNQHAIFAMKNKQSEKRMRQ